MGRDAADLWVEVAMTILMCSTCRMLPPVYSTVKVYVVASGEFYYQKHNWNSGKLARIKIAFSVTVATHSVIINLHTLA